MTNTLKRFLANHHHIKKPVKHMVIFYFATKVILFAYIATVLVMYFAQRSFLYYPDKNMLHPADYGIDMQEIALHTSDGINIASWYHPAPEDGFTIVYFHGNAGHLGYRMDRFAAFMEKGFGLLAVSWRGFGTSEGAPSKSGLYNDARAALDYLKSKNVNEKNIVLYGESLGTGVASKMAVEHKAAAVILEAPYTSIANRAQELYPLIPVKWMLKDNFNSIKLIPNIEEPLLILHGEDDMVIPPSHGKKLFSLAKSPKKLVIFPHNSHFNGNHREIADLIKEFIEKNIKKNSIIAQ